MSTGPDEMHALTPAHFLAGRSLLIVPTPSYLDMAQNRLNKYQHVQRMVQHFWNTWSKEYIHQLQQRSKWRNNNENIQIDQLVLIKEDNLPPSKWLMARVVKTISGTDGKVRVVELRTKNSILKRSIHKICILPIQENTSNIITDG